MLGSWVRAPAGSQELQKALDFQGLFFCLFAYRLKHHLISKEQQYSNQGNFYSKHHNQMSHYKIQIIETIVIIVLYLLTFFITKTIVNNTLKKTQLERARRKIIIKAMHLFTAIGAMVLIAGVWGLKQNEIAVFASTLLTALGIAFFAQWSLLSNITSSIILFFNHPLKLGDTIKVLDKEFSFEGEITDLSYFFIHIKTTSGEIITMPNSLVLQKTIAIIEKSDKH